MELVKRKWCYVLPPYVYDMTCDKCHGTNIEWSEWEHLIWCYDCKIDTEGDPGIFSGPIPIHTSQMLGIIFDRINLETEQIERFNIEETLAKGILVYDTPEEVKKKLDPKTLTKALLKDENPQDPYGDWIRRIGSKYFKLVPKRRKKNGDIRITS
jgi:hypothetical protein